MTLNPVVTPNTERLRFKVQRPYLLHKIFERKGTPFVYILQTNGTPFTYLVSIFAFLLTAVIASSGVVTVPYVHSFTEKI